MAVEGGRKVMVAIDESESSYYALIWTLENLIGTINGSGNPLIIYMAKPYPKNINIFAASLGAARAYCTFPTSPECVNCVHQQNVSVSLGISEKAKRICTNYGINAETIVEIGDPMQGICDAVQKHNINLLVIGDHEVGRFKRAFVGSVSNYCVCNSACPVLVVKKTE